MPLLILTATRVPTGQLSKDERLAGLDAHAGEAETRAGAGEGGLDEIEFAGGDAAGEDQQVGFRAWASAWSRASAVSAAAGRIHGSPPAAATMAASMGALELRIWPGPGGLDRDQLVSGGEDGHAGPNEDLERRVTAGGRESDLSGANHGPGGEQIVACEPARPAPRCSRPFSILRGGSQSDLVCGYL